MFMDEQWTTRRHNASETYCWWNITHWFLCCRENGVGYLDLTEPEDTTPLHANLIKSDGSTLYLTRYVFVMMLSDRVTVSESKMTAQHDLLIVWVTSGCASVCIYVCLCVCLCMSVCLCVSMCADTVVQRHCRSCRPSTTLSSRQTLLRREWLNYQ